MKTSMLEYCKIVLKKVSFNKRLFFKEYRKSRQWLKPQEVSELKDWLRKDKFTTLQESAMYMTRDSKLR